VQTGAAVLKFAAASSRAMPEKITHGMAEREPNRSLTNYGTVRGTVCDLQGPNMSDPVEEVVAPAAIERAFGIYQQLKQRDQSVLLQARKILTQHIYGMVDQGERDEQRLTVGGLIHLKAIERDHAIKSAQGCSD
jgi:hypothetical protein